ncbi:MAG: C-terminal helicase domain-containing protein, partial [Candidatus Omnitrophica bacterium]|nr:C-terminal helicase domain-containing protein [Candidatus Omnitrophota bacterium]
WNRVLVFVQMKHSADKVVKQLQSLKISAIAIHGNKSQGARTKALAKFKLGEIRVLVATDIAARGIDVDSISHVINYDLPNTPDTYIHRIGRTARAGAEGDAVSFCSASERDGLRAIEKMLRLTIPTERDNSFYSKEADQATGAAARPLPRVTRGSRGSSRNARTDTNSKRRTAPSSRPWQKNKGGGRSSTSRGR